MTNKFLILFSIIVAFGFLSFGYYEHLQKKETVNETITSSEVMSELDLMKNPNFLSLITQMDLKTPSEKMRVIVTKMVQGDNSQQGNFTTTLNEWTDIENPVEISKALRLSNVLRNSGKIEESKNILFHFLGEKTQDNHYQLMEKILIKVVNNKIQVDNTEKLLAVVVFDSLMNENSNDVYTMLDNSFKPTDLEMFQKTGDYGQIYIWQLIGLYNNKFYHNKLKTELSKLYKKYNPDYQGSLRYQESFLIFQ